MARTIDLSRDEAEMLVDILDHVLYGEPLPPMVPTDGRLNDLADTIREMFGMVMRSP
jgi:hypothetical protein